jgi:Cu/Ag efflux protein CusF
MHTQLRSLFIRFVLLAILPAALFAHDNKSSNPTKNCGCACCKGKEVCCCNEAKTVAEKANEIKRYAIRGVIVDVLGDRSELLVKHDKIPGYMTAMTMAFKVDAATLKAAQKGQTITGTLVRRGPEFWLEAVRITTVPAKP